MVASGSLVWCWRDGRWVPLRLSSINLSGAVTKAHWDAVKEFLRLAASQHLVLQEGALSHEQKRDLFSQQRRLKELQNNLAGKVFADESVSDDNNNSNEESLRTCGELSEELRDRIPKFDVLTWLENNDFSAEGEESPSSVSATAAASDEPRYVNNSQSVILRNLILVDPETNKSENNILNTVISDNDLKDSLNVKNALSSGFILPRKSPAIDFTINCLTDDSTANNNNNNNNVNICKNNANDQINKRLLVLTENNLKSVVSTLSNNFNKNFRTNDAENDKIVEKRQIPNTNILNYLQLIDRTGGKCVDDEKSSTLRWQKLVVSTKQSNKYNLDDKCRITDYVEKEDMKSLTLQPVKDAKDKEDKSDASSDILISPLQRHLCRPIKHKQPCRQPHKCDDRSLHGRKYPLNRNNTHPLDNLLKKEYSELELDQIPRVNSLSQTRLEWHQLIQKDKELASKDDIKINNKNSFSKVSINVLNLQRFSRLVRQRKNCDSSDGDEKKKLKKGSLKSKQLKRSDSNSEKKEDSRDGGFRSLRNKKHSLTHSFENYVDVPKDKVGAAVQWQRLVQRYRESKSAEDGSRYTEEPNGSGGRGKSDGKGKSDDQERYSDEPHKGGGCSPPLPNRAQKLKNFDKRGSIPEEQERYSDEPSQPQQGLQKAQISERKLKKQREAWSRNVRKLSDSLRPYVPQE
ncbi:UNVERIFIED_CONTAM: hypothetical protein PYX00_001004 [Menopon gallinae]|uniref:Uncharacterized protein n=1 Tax=Menopon gallinae TaxID=328185 RepID=A0AAW2IAR0_9NEOP